MGVYCGSFLKNGGTPSRLFTFLFLVLAISVVVCASCISIFMYRSSIVTIHEYIQSSQYVVIVAADALHTY